MKQDILQLTSTANLNVDYSIISFTNPDGTKVSIGKNQSKVIRITSKENVLYIEELNNIKQ